MRANECIKFPNLEIRNLDMKKAAAYLGEICSFHVDIVKVVKVTSTYVHENYVKIELAPNKLRECMFDLMPLYWAIFK